MKIRSIDECILVSVGFSKQPIAVRNIWRTIKKVLKNEYSSTFNFYRATRYACKRLKKYQLITIDDDGCSITPKGLDLVRDVVKGWTNPEIFLTRFNEVEKEIND